jgi:hypothetical protein
MGYGLLDHGLSPAPATGSKVQVSLWMRRLGPGAGARSLEPEACSQ